MIEIRDRSPVVDPSAWIAPGAILVGEVSLGASASAWYNAVLRGDLARISIGANSNVQDGCVLHADPGAPLFIGDSVSVGHGAVLHGCTVEDSVLIGMGAIVMNGATIGAGSIIAAGTVVLEGTDVPPGSLMAGTPSLLRRSVTPGERDAIIHNANEYAQLAAEHAAATRSK